MFPVVPSLDISSSVERSGTRCSDWPGCRIYRMRHTG